jgi:hypothetical protein
VSRTVFYCRCGARLDGASARADHRCRTDAPKPSVRRFPIYDLNPLGTRERESAAQGDHVFLCGHADPQALGDIEATNAANALLATRERWPTYPPQQLHAVEQRR